jgi:hypothetical protein
MVFYTTLVFQNKQHGKAWGASGKMRVVENNMLFYTVFWWCIYHGILHSISGKIAQLMGYVGISELGTPGILSV